MDWLRHVASLAQQEEAKAIVFAMQADMTELRNKPDDVMCETVAESDKHPCDGFTKMRAMIRDIAANADRPVLVIHGDTAPFTIGQSFAGEEDPNLWRLNAAGDTGPTYGVRDVTVVTVSVDNAGMPFSAQGLLSGKKPKQK